MADELEQHDTEDDDDVADSDSVSETASQAHPHSTSKPAPSEAELDQIVDQWPHIRRRANRRARGLLTLHLATRDVEVACDGEAAMRAASIVAGTAGSEAMDPLSPNSSALDGWIVFRPNDVLAVTWTPVSHPTPDVATIDPIVS